MNQNKNNRINKNSWGIKSRGSFNINSKRMAKIYIGGVENNIVMMIMIMTMIKIKWEIKVKISIKVKIKAKIKIRIKIRIKCQMMLSILIKYYGWR